MKNITLKEIQKTAERLHGSKMTLKQALFTKKTLESNDPTLAALEVYNVGGKHNKGKILTEKEKRATGGVIASENMNHPKIKDTIEDIADRVGMTKEFVMGSLVEDIKLFQGKRRHNELALAGKWLQLEKPSQQNTVVLNIDNDQLRRLDTL